MTCVSLACSSALACWLRASEAMRSAAVASESHVLRLPCERRTTCGVHADHVQVQAPSSRGGVGGRRVRCRRRVRTARFQHSSPRRSGWSVAEARSSVLPHRPPGRPRPRHQRAPPFVKVLPTTTLTLLVDCETALCILARDPSDSMVAARVALSAVRWGLRSGAQPNRRHAWRHRLRQTRRRPRATPAAACRRAVCRRGAVEGSIRLR